MASSIYSHVSHSVTNNNFSSYAAIESAKIRADAIVLPHLVGKGIGQFSQESKDRKVYSCRICKVPAKGHVCPYRNPDGTKEDRWNSLPQNPVNVSNYGITGKAIIAAIPGQEPAVAASLYVPPFLTTKKMDSIATGTSAKSDSRNLSSNHVSFGSNRISELMHHNINKNEPNRKAKKLKIVTEPLQSSAVTSTAVVTPNTIAPSPYTASYRAGDFFTPHSFTMNRKNEKTTAQPGVRVALTQILQKSDIGVVTKYEPKTTNESSQVNTQPNIVSKSYKNDAIHQTKMDTKHLPMDVFPSNQNRETQSVKRIKSRKVYSCKFCGAPLKGHRCLKMHQSPRTLPSNIYSNPLPLPNPQRAYQPYVPAATATSNILAIGSNSIGYIPNRLPSQPGGFVSSAKKATRKRKKVSKTGLQLHRTSVPASTCAFGPSSITSCSKSSSKPVTTFLVDTQSIANHCKAAESKPRESPKNGLLDVLAAAAAIDGSSSDGQANPIQHQGQANHCLPVANQLWPVASASADSTLRPSQQDENGCSNRITIPIIDKINSKVEEDRLEFFIQEIDKEALVRQHGECSMPYGHIEPWSRDCTREIGEEIDVILENYRSEQHCSLINKNENHEHSLLLLLQNKLAC